LRDQISTNLELDSRKLIVQYLNEILTAEDRKSSRNIWELLSELV
jgi:hypothetical protein